MNICYHYILLLLILLVTKQIASRRQKNSYPDWRVICEQHRPRLSCTTKLTIHNLLMRTNHTLCTLDYFVFFTSQWYLLKYCVYSSRCIYPFFNDISYVCIEQNCSWAYCAQPTYYNKDISYLFNYLLTLF